MAGRLGAAADLPPEARALLADVPGAHRVAAGGSAWVPREIGGLPEVGHVQILDRRLENGLRVTIVGDPRLTTVAVVQRVGAGSADEPPEQAGLAHLVEHLLFSGGSPGGERSWEHSTRRLGAEANAFTTWDETTYTTVAPPEALKALLELEGWRVTHFSVDPVALDREREIVMDERRIRSGMSESARGATGLQASLFPDHPYGRNIGGEDATLAHIDEAAVQAFFGRAYTAANLHLVIAGPLAPAAILPVVAQCWGALPAGSAMPPRDPAQLTDRRRVSADLDIPGPRWVGVALPLSPDRDCAPAAGPAACVPSPVSTEVAVELLELYGRRQVARGLSLEALSLVPVEVGRWQGSGGGYVVVTARRRSPFLVALQNTGAGLVGLTTTMASALLGTPVVILPAPTNVTARGVEDDLGEVGASFINERGVRMARDQAALEAWLSSWSSLDRALTIAALTARGFDPGVSYPALLREVEPAEVKAAWRSITARDPLHLVLR